MADDPNEDSWLYGGSNPEPPEDEDTKDDILSTENAEVDEKLLDNEPENAVILADLACVRHIHSEFPIPLF